jgi:hypothetical protein
LDLLLFVCLFVVASCCCSLSLCFALVDGSVL